MAWPHITRASVGADQAVTVTTGTGFRSRDNSNREFPVLLMPVGPGGATGAWATLITLVQTFADPGYLSDGDLDFEAVVEAQITGGATGEIRLTDGTVNGTAVTVTAAAYTDHTVVLALTPGRQIDVQGRVTVGTGTLSVQISTRRADARVVTQ